MVFLKSRNIKAILIFVQVVFISQISFPQYSFENSFIDARANVSYVLTHHNKMQHLVNGHFVFPEISYLKRTSGNKFWHGIYNYPYYGVTVHYNNFANNEILGHAFGVYPFIILPKFINERNVLNFRLGSGLAYITNPYDRIANHKNVAISTYLNLCISLGVEWEQHLTKQLIIYEGVSIVHFSNGALRMPNTGINLPSISLGLRYKLSNDDFQPSIPEPIEFQKYFFSNIMIAGGLNEIYPTYGKKYPAFSLSYGYNFKLSLKRSLGLFLDLTYNTSNFESLSRKNTNAKNLDIIRPGISLGHELYFDRMSFVFHLGHYLYAKEDIDGFIYNRVGYKWYFSDYLFFNLTLKSHLFRADYVECGLGLKF